MAFIPCEYTCQCSLSIYAGGQFAAQNTFYIQRLDDTPWDAVTLEELSIQIDDVIQELGDVVFTTQINNYILNMRDLTTEAGAVFNTSGVIAAASGQVSAPQQACWCVSLRSGLAGRSRRGRLYHGGMAEGMMVQGVVISGDRAAILAFWEAMLITSPAVISARGVIVSRYSADNPPGVGVMTPITAVIATSASTSTQRRRAKNHLGA